MVITSESGIRAARANPAASSLVLDHDPALTVEQVRAHAYRALAAARALPVASSAPASVAPTTRPSLRARLPRLALPAIVAAAAGAGRVLGFVLPAPVGGLAIAVGALPIARRAVHTLRVERRLTIDVLDIVAITLTTLRGSFLAPASMIGLVEIGEAIRERTARASERELLDLLDSIAEIVWVERGGARHRVPVADVRRGEVVVLYPGDRIPVDGRVVEGRALIDEHQLTGEAMPVLREEGEVAYAATLVREGHLHIAVEHTGRETRAGRIVALMREAPVHDTRIENYAGKVADRIVGPSLLLAGLVLLVTRDAQRAASVLIADFATGIRVSVPTTVLAALSHAAQRGVVVRSGRALEQLAGIDTVVFDKTGTVTEGEPVVTRVLGVSEGVEPDELLALAATVEQRLTHPVAEAVMRHAADRGVAPRRRGEWHYEIGLGVRAEVDGADVLVGSDRLLLRHGVPVTSADRLGREGESLIYVARDGELEGVMSYADPIRREAAAVIAELRDRHGMAIHLLTGDKSEVAHRVGSTLGIAPDDVHGDLFPEDKAAVVRQLRDEGRSVAFVGDGINDLPALAYASVAVSFGGATDVARETADVVLMDGLTGLPAALTTAERALRIIHQNIAIVGGVNLVAMTAATTRGLGPVTAAVVHNGSTVVAALNGLRPLLHTLPRPTRPPAPTIEEAF